MSFEAVKVCLNFVIASIPESFSRRVQATSIAVCHVCTIGSAFADRLRMGLVTERTNGTEATDNKRGDSQHQTGGLYNYARHRTQRDKVLAPQVDEFNGK